MLSHRFERARELYADHWLGFSEVQLHQFLETSGFKNIEVTVDGAPVAENVPSLSSHTAGFRASFSDFAIAALRGRIAAAADVILPGSSLDVVAYGCTSASMAIGEEKESLPCLMSASSSPTIW